MMKKAVTESSDFYRSQQGAQGFDARRAANKEARKERKATLSQWYGMKRTILTEVQKQDLDLLQYRNFVSKDATHQAPKKSTMDQTEFVEFGYFAETGRNKRRRFKTFADEWMEDNPELEKIVKQRVKRNIKANKKEKEKTARRDKAAARKSRDAKTSKRKGKKGAGGGGAM
jgi:small-conductance mechanosensitive channel